MSVIKVKCVDHALMYENTPVIPAYSEAVDSVEFDFCDQWTTYTRSAAFWRLPDMSDNISVLLDENDRCLIPSEILEKDGPFFLGASGILGNLKRSTEPLVYIVSHGTPVDLGSGAGAMPDPTPSVYAQILASYQEVKGDCEDLTDSKADKVTGATAGNLATLDAEGNIVDSGSSVADVTLDVPGMTAIGTVADADLLPLHDTSASAWRKITFAGLIDAIKTAIGSFFAKTATYNVAVPASGWSASAPYSQTVNVAGILATDSPIPGVVYGDNATTNAGIKDAWSCVDRITTADGMVTLICFDDAPANDLSINLKVVR